MGDKTTPKWGINPPPTPFLAFLTPGVVLCHLGVFLSPLLGGGGLSPQRGGLSPHWVFWGGITLLGWFYPPFSVIFCIYWTGRGGGG